MRYSSLLLIIAVLYSGVAAAEKTALEKLCEGYERKQAMLQRRLKVGARPWEKTKIREQQQRIAADQAKFCRPKAAASSAGASGAAASGAAAPAKGGTRR